MYFDKKGRSIYTILNNYPKITLCKKTIYNYIEMGLFKDLDVTSLTLKRKIRRKASKNKLKKRKEPENYEVRTYTDYRNYKIQNPNIPTTEMDTGEIRSKIFYCVPQQSSQKPHVENNHNFIREILPNSQS